MNAYNTCTWSFPCLRSTLAQMNLHSLTIQCRNQLLLVAVTLIGCQNTDPRRPGGKVVELRGLEGPVPSADSAIVRVLNVDASGLCCVLCTNRVSVFCTSGTSVTESCIQRIRACVRERDDRIEHLVLLDRQSDGSLFVETMLQLFDVEEVILPFREPGSAEDVSLGAALEAARGRGTRVVILEGDVTLQRTQDRPGAIVQLIGLLQPSAENLDGSPRCLVRIEVGSDRCYILPRSLTSRRSARAIVPGTLPDPKFTALRRDLETLRGAATVLMPLLSGNDIDALPPEVSDSTQISVFAVATRSPLLSAEFRKKTKAVILCEWISIENTLLCNFSTPDPREPGIRRAEFCVLLDSQRVTVGNRTWYYPAIDAYGQ